MKRLKYLFTKLLVITTLISLTSCTLLLWKENLTPWEVFNGVTTESKLSTQIYQTTAFGIAKNNVFFLKTKNFYIISNTQYIEKPKEFFDYLKNNTKTNFLELQKKNNLRLNNRPINPLIIGKSLKNATFKITDSLQYDIFLSTNQPQDIELIENFSSPLNVEIENRLISQLNQIQTLIYQIVLTPLAIICDILAFPITIPAYIGLFKND